MGRFDGQTVLITGAARGQGRSHAVGFAKEGADVAICDLCAQIETVPYQMGTQDELNHTKELVEQQGHRCLSMKADVRSFQQMQTFADKTMQEFGKIDVCLANAGIFSPSPVAQMSEQTWRDMIDTNLTGVFNTMRAVLPHMVKQQRGKVIATSSELGLTGMSMFGHYDAAKHGIIGLVESAALEVASHGITVNAVCPTTVNTPMIQNEATYKTFVPNQPKPTQEQAKQAMTKTNAIPIPWVEPEDVTRAILFLASDDARYITGEPLPVDAGALASAVM